MKKSHMLLMLLCCLVPLVGFAMIYFFKFPLNSVLFYGMIIFCPLSHLLMMAFMGHDHSSSAQHSEHQHHTASLPSSTQEK